MRARAHTHTHPNVHVVKGTQLNSIKKKPDGPGGENGECVCDSGNSNRGGELKIFHIEKRINIHTNVGSFVRSFVRMKV